MFGEQIFNFSNKNQLDNLTDKFLIASPFVGLNEVFNKSLIYITDHGEDGAVGLIINNNLFINKKLNRNLNKMFFDDPQLKNAKFEIFLGGPVDQEKGFILHSNDYDKDLLIKCSKDISISCSINTLKDIIKGSGPKHSLLAMGCTQWKAGQIEKEIANNLWIVAKGSMDIIFDTQNDKKWENALKSLGIDTKLFCGQVGHG